MWRFLLSCIRIIGIVTKYFTPSTDVISFLKVPFSANPNSYPISFNLLNSFGAKDGSSNLPMNEWSWWCQHTKNIFCPKKKDFFFGMRWWQFSPLFSDWKWFSCSGDNPIKQGSQTLASHKIIFLNFSVRKLVVLK